MIDSRSRNFIHSTWNLYANFEVRHPSLYFSFLRWGIRINCTYNIIVLKLIYAITGSLIRVDNKNCIKIIVLSNGSWRERDHAISCVAEESVIHDVARYQQRHMVSSQISRAERYKERLCRLEVETRLGMKRIEEGRKGRARGRREGVSGRGSWHRLYSFTRSFIVRTPPRGSTKPLAHSEPVTRPCGTCTHVCVHVRMHVCIRSFFRPFFPVRAYRPPSLRRRRRRRGYRQGFRTHTPWWTA